MLPCGKQWKGKWVPVPHPGRNGFFTCENSGTPNTYPRLSVEFLQTFHESISERNAGQFRHSTKECRVRFVGRAGKPVTVLALQTRCQFPHVNKPSSSTYPRLCGFPYACRGCQGWFKHVSGTRPVQRQTLCRTVLNGGTSMERVACSENAS